MSGTKKSPIRKIAGNEHAEIPSGRIRERKCDVGTAETGSIGHSNPGTEWPIVGEDGIKF